MSGRFELRSRRKIQLRFVEPESYSGLKEGQATRNYKTAKIRLGRNADSWGTIKKVGRRGSLTQDHGKGKVKLFL